MYTRIKYILKKVLPKKILFNLEPKLRAIYYQFYRGEKFHCNICNKGLSKFIQLSANNLMCPNCGSVSRDRRLCQILSSEFIKENIEILDFSPSRCIYRKLKKYPLIKYTSTDLSGNFISDVKFDITDIKTQSDTYDLIICYHILEHIENDYQAMSELFRVLKNKGICLIQTPFTEGNIYEDSSIITEKDRLKYHGQADHVRIYSVNGLRERLLKSGFQVEVRKFEETKENEYGFANDETILICTKNG